MDSTTVARAKSDYYSRLLKSALERCPVLVKHPPLFSAAQVHELRNPLNNIDLAVGELKMLIIDEEQNSYLDMILRASKKVMNLVNDMARDQPLETIEAKRYSIHTLLDEVLEMAADQLMLKTINVRKNYASKGFTRIADGPALKIAFTNIIVNAIDAMEHNGELTVETNYTNGVFSIDIADNGCGISKENLPHIFKPYYTSKAEGVGIGLPATIDILKAHLVEVRVESEEGVGTKFILSFPRHRITKKELLASVKD